ncbi:DUF1223 domain-containing protein [Longitalea arenae]|uniref:DUF1223 domain-containing protein n=1 Tax=Longitalea arenae TaxID=2812558 RepID=UPI001F083A67|nr:DUF1223 domain-containing protein [Longitalea arenae]
MVTYMKAMQLVFAVFLAAGILSSCNEVSGKELNIREYAFNDSGLQVITHWINEKAGTMSVLYGNAAAMEYHASDTGKHAAGESYTLATYKQQDNTRWYGSKINGELQQLETVSLEPRPENAGTGYRISYENRRQASGATADTTGRVQTILDAKVSLFPYYKRSTPVDNKGFALVELFTSEGCSSCPPADKLLEKLQQDNASQPVYVIAYHVDYWDHQGWKDRFSDRAYTERQRSYADWLRVESIYTPQAVVNGASEYVGSDETRIVKAVTSEVNKAADNTLTLTGQQQDRQLTVNYELTGQTRNKTLFLALVQKHAATQVMAGENEGRALTHVQVVRQLLPVEVKPSGHATISLPADYTKDGWELIGFLQHTGTGRITAATRLN